MKKINRIKIVNSIPEKDQSGIAEYIGKEYNAIETWLNTDSGLEHGQIGVILEDIKNNPKQQWSILNKEEYEIIE